MLCPRLDHFVRFNFNGSVSRCGHMVSPPQFESLDAMNASGWLKEIKNTFANDQWPAECIRCQETENLNNTSIRLNSFKEYESRSINDYLQVGGALDNICNSACQFCNEHLSTKIGSLISVANYPKINNLERFYNLPQERIEHLDINGGEPSASKNYKHLLENLPPNLKTLRVNTNCSIMIPQLKTIQDRGVKVTLTVSFDGIGPVHDYVRWPIRWDKFVKNLFAYKNFGLSFVNLWTTVNSLNVNDLDNIFKFVDDHKFDHSFAFLKGPPALNAAYRNKFTEHAKKKFINSTDPRLQQISTIIAIDSNNQLELDNFTQKQDHLRNINVLNFINID